jgi:hypothetical protein
MTDRKPAASLTVADLRAFPVWEFVNDELPDEDETWVSPVRLLPVLDLGNTVVGTQVFLANGEKAFALLANICPQNARATQHFLSIKIELGGEWFALARYHDEDAPSHWPAALAAFLGLDSDQVFPITYDVRSIATGRDDALAGVIRATPSERLSKEQLMDLILA